MLLKKIQAHIGNWLTSIESIKSKKSSRYIPALSFDWLKLVYDPLLKWGMRVETYKRRLIMQATFEPGNRVLYLGRGTGTLTVMIKQAFSYVEITGLDGDPWVLEIARAKATQSGVTITWERGQIPARSTSPSINARRKGGVCGTMDRRLCSRSHVKSIRAMSTASHAG